MKKIRFIFILFLFVAVAEAQHVAMFSNFRNMDVSVNPAYAGSKNYLEANSFFRSRWSGIEGAPRELLVTAHLPLKDIRHNTGFVFRNDRIGVTSSNEVSAIYAFRFPVSKGRLAFALSAGLRSVRDNWSEVLLNTAGDETFNEGTEKYIFPAAGVGSYYSGKKIFMGISAPQLLEKNQSVRYKPFLLHGGFLLFSENEFPFRIQGQIKYLHNSPLQYEGNAALNYKAVAGIGAGYRSAGSFYLFTESSVNSQLRIGYAYEIFSSPGIGGSCHEIMLKYGFKYSVEVQDPRKF